MQIMQAAIELTSIDPERRRARHYGVALCPTLFGGYGLLISWGRIGRPPRVRIETFETPAAIGARLTELLTRRRAHGYVVAPCAASDSSRQELDPERRQLPIDHVIQERDACGPALAARAAQLAESRA
jgi:predicted DNA-binding WGR domain protein